MSDTGEGEGKRRLWRAATDFHSYYPSDFAGDEDSETALNWLARDYVRHFSTQAERWVDASPTWPVPWQDACGSSDDMVLLTAEQLSAMREEIGDVVARYRRVGQGNPEAKRIAVYLFAYALDLENAPGAMTTHLTPRAAERRYYLLTTTRWLPVGFVVGIFILVMTSRGLTIAQAATIGSVMGLTCFFLELPTSGFADAVGRRPVYLTAAVINVVAITGYALAQSFWAFVVAGALMGAFRALDSGPLEAWFVDTVHETTPGADVDRQLSRAGSILGAAIAVGAVLSGLLIWWNPAATVLGHEDASALDVAVWVSVALSVVHLVVSGRRDAREPAARRLRAHPPLARARRGPPDPGR